MNHSTVSQNTAGDMFHLAIRATRVATLWSGACDGNDAFIQVNNLQNIKLQGAMANQYFYNTRCLSTPDGDGLLALLDTNRNAWFLT